MTVGVVGDADDVLADARSSRSSIAAMRPGTRTRSSGHGSTPRPTPWTTAPRADGAPTVVPARTPRRVVPAVGRGLLDRGRADDVGARERRFPAVAEHAGAEHDPLASARRVRAGARSTRPRRAARRRRRTPASSTRAPRTRGADAPQVARRRAGSQRGDHRREPGRATVAARADARDLVGLGNRPELREQRPGVDELRGGHRRREEHVRARRHAVDADAAARRARRRSRERARAASRDST